MSGLLMKPPQRLACIASAAALIGSTVLVAPVATGVPYRCASVDQTSTALVIPEARPGVDGQVHPDCAGSGMAGFTFSRSGATYLRMDLFTGNNTHRRGTGKARGWWLDKDTARHAGKAWKLKDRSGKVRASIYSDGKFACSYTLKCAV